MNFTGYQILDLRSIMGITSIYNGRDVEYVIVRARSRFGYGTLQLRTNFQPNSAIMSVGTYPQEYYLHVTGNRELGWGVNTLELQIMGDMTIETIAVQLDRRRRY